MSTPAPTVELGHHARGGLAPAIMAILDRGVQRRPQAAAGMRGEIELNLHEASAPVRITFAPERVLVEDGSLSAPDLRVTGALTDLVGLMAVPLVGGLPNPIDRRGRAALGLVAGRRVKIEGRVSLMRQLLGVMQV